MTYSRTVKGLWDQVTWEHVVPVLTVICAIDSSALVYFMMYFKACGLNAVDSRTSYASIAGSAQPVKYVNTFGGVRGELLMLGVRSRSANAEDEHIQGCAKKGAYLYTCRASGVCHVPS